MSSNKDRHRRSDDESSTNSSTKEQRLKERLLSRRKSRDDDSTSAHKTSENHRSNASSSSSSQRRSRSRTRSDSRSRSKRANETRDRERDRDRDRSRDRPRGRGRSTYQSSVDRESSRSYDYGGHGERGGRYSEQYDRYGRAIPPRQSSSRGGGGGYHYADMPDYRNNRYGGFPSNGRGGGYIDDYDYGGRNGGAYGDPRGDYPPRRAPSRSRENRRYSRPARSRSASRTKSRKESRRSRGRRRSRSRSKSRSSSHDSSARSRSSSASKEEEPEKKKNEEEDKLDRERRTIFLSQLVIRTTERDIIKYFKREHGIKVKDVIFLKDRHQRGHRGLAYVELAKIKDVAKAVEKAHKQIPDFQRFPIQVRQSEAEKNYDAHGVVTNADGTESIVPVQQVYVGNIERVVTQQQLQYLFTQFGTVTKVNIQLDPMTQISRGFAFLSFTDAKAANLAIQTMQGQLLADRALKTGWATVATQNGAQTSNEFPEDADARIAKANEALVKLTGNGISAFASLAQLGFAAPAAATSTSTAEAALNAALGSTEVTSGTASTIDQNPSPFLLVRNMFDREAETEENWQDDIKEEFLEESGKYGTVEFVKVEHTLPGGMVYVKFKDEADAVKCKVALAGRWFDGRQLVVEYKSKEEFPDDCDAV